MWAPTDRLNVMWKNFRFYKHFIYRSLNENRIRNKNQLGIWEQLWELKKNKKNKIKRLEAQFVSCVLFFL